MLITKEIRDTLAPPGLVISLTGYRPIPRYDATAWTGASIDSTVDYVTWANVGSVTFPTADADPTTPATRDFTLTVDPTTTYLRVTFVDSHGNYSPADALSIFPAIGDLASVRDVSMRLGKDPTEGELNQIQQLLHMATISIFGGIDQVNTWQPPVGAMPFLNLMCTELVCRSLPNPSSLAQKSERIGTYQYTDTYAIRGLPTPGLMLTAEERLTVRRVVYGANTAGVTVQSLADQYAEQVWPYQIAYGMYYSNFSDLIVWK